MTEKQPTSQSVTLIETDSGKSFVIFSDDYPLRITKTILVEGKNVEREYQLSETKNKKLNLNA